jgi:hypothetical protein
MSHVMLVYCNFPHCATAMYWDLETQNQQLAPLSGSFLPSFSSDASRQYWLNFNTDLYTGGYVSPSLGLLKH